MAPQKAIDLDNTENIYSTTITSTLCQQRLTMLHKNAAYSRYFSLKWVISLTGSPENVIQFNYYVIGHHKQ